jgi:hypothetical protein
MRRLLWSSDKNSLQNSRYDLKHVDIKPNNYSIARSFVLNYKWYSLLYAGVKSVDANVETKNVAVTCEESVITTTLLEALQKWSVSSGKSVALA